MASDELASTIDELARKLDDVPAEEIREELQTYLDHGVPLHQAKKDLEQSLADGGNDAGTGGSAPSEPVEKSVDELEPEDQSVNATVKILTVNEREITARGEETTIWSGMLGDETGAVAYTSWRDVGLEPGMVVRIENAYVTEWQDEPQLNVGDYAEVEAVDETIEVPSAADRATEHDVTELEDGMRSVTVEGRVLSKSARDVTVKGEDTTLWEGELADASGKIPYTAWEEPSFDTGDALRIENAYVRSFRGVPQLNFGGNARITALDDDAVSPADELADVEGPGLSVSEEDVRDLAPGQSSVAVVARVLDLDERTITTDDGERQLWEGELADATGRIPYTAWEQPSFGAGDVVRIENAYVRSFRGLPQLNFGDNAEVTVEPGDDLPPADELATVRDLTVRELQDAQGAIGVRATGLVVDVREGSGLILRCTECRRVLQDGSCRKHGDVDGVPDLRVKAVLDDGTGAVMTVLDRSVTEAFLGTSLEECQGEAEAAGRREVVREQVEDELIAKRAQASGNATHDDYGTTLVAREITVQSPEGIEDRAEAMLETVHALAEEVRA
jgi:replication factor A1